MLIPFMLAMALCANLYADAATTSTTSTQVHAPSSHAKDQAPNAVDVPLTQAQIDCSKADNIRAGLCDIVVMDDADPSSYN